MLSPSAVLPERPPPLGLARLGLLSVVLALTTASPLPSQANPATPALAGISNHGRNGDRPYVTAGDRAYLIGTQDGNFPDLGGHVPGEMGGLWLHPIKLIDGFRAAVTDVTTGRQTVLSASAELITYPYGNRFRYGTVLPGLTIERFEFSPDGHPGVMIQYEFGNTTAGRKELHFDLSVRTDLRPVWLSERRGLEDARDTVAWQPRSGMFVAGDTENPWFAVWGATPTAAASSVASGPPLHTAGMGVTAASRYSLSVAPGRTSTLTFVFTGSATDRERAVDAYRHLAGNHERLLAAKKGHYDSLVARARVRIPDQRLRQVYDWVRVNTQWLVREVPGIGRGVGGGLMEYPWWFGTEAYTLQALIAAGDFELARQTLRLLHDQSMKANGNGRIVHEVTTNGVVSNPGNTQETAQFILTVGKLVDWTGDLAFAQEMYPAMRLGLDWLLTEKDSNRNLFPDGHGIMEVLGLNAELVDVAVYTQQALQATARVAGILNDSAAAARYQRLAARLEAGIDERFWLEERSSYADFHGSRAQAISAADGAIRQIELKGPTKLRPRDHAVIERYRELKRRFAALPDTSRGWITNENWVIVTPVEAGIAPRARAIRLLDRIRRENVGTYGPYLSAVERDRMMTIATGVQAVAEARYGRIDEALGYVDRIVRTFNRVTPGSISEMMPDAGCFTIAWTSYGIVVPLIEHVFGIRPDATTKTVVVEPHLPAGWEDMSLDDLPVGTTTVSLSVARTEEGIAYVVGAREPGWTFILKHPESPGARYVLNGRPVSDGGSGIRMSGRRRHRLVVQP